MDEDAFFKRYERAHKKEPGVPGLEMNGPIVKKTKTGQIGMELELEGRYLRLGDGHFESVISPTTRARWATHEDGSLRNGGREFVLSTPVKPDELDGMLEGLFKQIALYKGVVENTNRCSTHVHINVGGKKINEITSLIAMWYMFEDAIIKWCGEERKSNHFCLSLADSPSTMRAWRSYLQTGRRPSNDGLKYSALNILPIWRWGSVEFRCGQAAHEPTRPAEFGKFLAALSDISEEQFKNPEDIASALSETGARAIFERIVDRAALPGRFYDEVVGGLDFEGSCMTGLRNCQSIVLGFPWNDWMKEIDKEYVPNPFGGKKMAKASPSPEIAFPERNDEWDAILGDAPRRLNPDGWAIPDPAPRVGLGRRTVRLNNGRFENVPAEPVVPRRPLEDGEEDIGMWSVNRRRTERIHVLVGQGLNADEAIRRERREEENRRMAAARDAARAIREDEDEF